MLIENQTCHEKERFEYRLFGQNFVHVIRENVTRKSLRKLYCTCRTNVVLIRTVNDWSMRMYLNDFKRSNCPLICSMCYIYVGYQCEDLPVYAT